MISATGYLGFSSLGPIALRPYFSISLLLSCRVLLNYFAITTIALSGEDVNIDYVVFLHSLPIEKFIPLVVIL